MSKGVKQFVWQILASIVRTIPSGLIKQLCDLAFESQQTQKSPSQGLIVLLEIQTRLRWYIDQQAMNYSNGIHPKHRLMDYHHFFKERIRPSDKVLDIGCGYGALANTLAGICEKVTGVDINPDHLVTAREKFSQDNVSYLLCDVTREHLEGNFSVIVMSNVLEHLENRSELLRSFIERYSPRTILLRVPMLNRHWDVPLRKELNLQHFLDPTHTIEYTFPSFETEMTNAGLKIIDHKICWGEIWAEVEKGA